MILHHGFITHLTTYERYLDKREAQTLGYSETVTLWIPLSLSVGRVPEVLWFSEGE